MSFSQFKETDSYLISEKHCSCIEFVLNNGDRHGFHASQLLHYRLEANEGGKDDAPEKLTLAFATADVTLTGSRLERVSDHLRDGNLLAVRIFPTRYAGLDKTKCAVTSISVEPIRKE